MIWSASFFVLLGFLALFGVVLAVSPPIRQLFQRSIRQPSFAVVVVVLGLAAASLNAATQYLQLHFKKLPVPLARELETIPARMGPWVQVSRDERLPADIEEALGTEQYIFRDYVDERIVGRNVIESFEGKSSEERRRMVAGIVAMNPRAVVNIAVTYYTGMVDTVAHIPDRCYIADGYQPSTYERVRWEAGRNEPVQARFINFEDQTGFSKITRNVAYFFHVNGRYESDPLGVRRSLQNLLERYGYYAKIELMSLVQNQDDAGEVIRDFLASSLDEIERTFPDWNSLKDEGVR